MSLKRVPPQSQADGQELTVLGVELALEPGPSPHLCKPYTWAGGQRGRCLWVSSSGPMASLELNGSVSPVMKGALSPLPGTVHQDKGNDWPAPQAAPSEAASLEGKREGGGHWDRLLLIRLCRE